MPRCRCGRGLKWQPIYNRFTNNERIGRYYYCPKCMKTAKECDCISKEKDIFWSQISKEWRFDEG